MAVHKQHSIYSSANRARLSAGFLFLLICVLLSCPLKRELRIMLGAAPVAHKMPQQATVPERSTTLLRQLSPDCSSELALLDHLDLGSLQAEVLLKSPLAFVFALTFPAILLLLLHRKGPGSYGRHESFSHLLSIPLFLRLRRIIV